MTWLAKGADWLKLVGVLAELQPMDLARLVSQVRAQRRTAPLPEANGDFYAMGDLLTPEEQEIRLRVRDVMQREVAPIVNDYWRRGEFPMQVIPKLAALDIAGMTLQG